MRPKRLADATSPPNPLTGPHCELDSALAKATRAERFDVHSRSLNGGGNSRLTRSMATATVAKPRFDMTVLWPKLAQQEPGVGFFVRCTRMRSPGERKKMIDHAHRLSMTRTVKFVALSRASVCYAARPVSDTDLAASGEVGHWAVCRGSTAARVACPIVAATHTLQGSISET